MIHIDSKLQAPGYISVTAHITEDEPEILYADFVALARIMIEREKVMDVAIKAFESVDKQMSARFIAATKEKHYAYM